MPTNTAAPWSIIFAIPTDEIKAFPTEVDQVKAERIAKLMGENWLTVKSYSAAATLKTGELAIQNKNGETFTLPSVATSNQIIGIYTSSGIASCKVTTSGGALIYGDFVNGAATLTLTTNQHVTLQSNGSSWQIVAGEPENKATVKGDRLGTGTVRQETGTAQSFMSWGNIAATAAISGGTGDYTAAKIGTGEYEIKWTTPKVSASYAVVAQVLESEAVPITLPPTTSGFTVRTKVIGGALTNLAWCFTVAATS